MGAIGVVAVLVGSSAALSSSLRILSGGSETMARQGIAAGMAGVIAVGAETMRPTIKQRSSRERRSRNRRASEGWARREVGGVKGCNDLGDLVG